MLPWLLIGAFAVAVLALNFWASRDRFGDYSVQVASAMVTIWLLTTAAYLWLIPRDGQYLNSMIDVALMGWATAELKRRPEIWRAALVVLLIFQCCAHVVYATHPRAQGVLHTYKATLNVAYLAELMAIGSVGGRDVWRRWWLRPHGNLRLFGSAAGRSVHRRLPPA